LDKLELSCYNFKKDKKEISGEGIIFELSGTVSQLPQGSFFYVTLYIETFVKGKTREIA